jgi:hypothetical protein
VIYHQAGELPSHSMLTTEGIGEGQTP